MTTSNKGTRPRGACLCRWSNIRLNAALEGRYAIERELGEGGMAAVYLVRGGGTPPCDAGG